MLNTLSRGFRKAPLVKQQAETLLSGIVVVSFNEKRQSTKYVEVMFSGEDNRSVLMIYKNKEKKKSEVAVDLTQARIIINQDTAHSIACVVREGRVYALELSPEREDLERVIAKWRSVFKVAENPHGMFSVITMTGDTRGSIVLVTVPNHTSPDPVKLRYLHGPLKDQEIRVDQISRVEKYHQHEVWLETHTGDTFHFISKRQETLYSKLEAQSQQFPTNQLIGTKPGNSNDSTFYASKSGYTPAFNTNRAVKPVDYISRSGLPEPAAPPPISTNPPISNKKLISYPAPPPALPDIDDYLPMDGRPKPGFGAPQNDYFGLPGPPEDDYLPMDQAKPGYGLPGPPEDDYLPMDQTRLPGPPEGDYLPMGLEYRDPLIDDYLAMEDLQLHKFDEIESDYPAEEEESPEDEYWDPSIVNTQLYRPPVPPRHTPPTLPEPPPIQQNSLPDIIVNKDKYCVEREFMTFDEARKIRTRRISENVTCIRLIDTDIVAVKNRRVSEQAPAYPPSRTPPGARKQEQAPTRTPPGARKQQGISSPPVLPRRRDVTPLATHCKKPSTPKQHKKRPKSFVEVEKTLRCPAEPARPKSPRPTERKSWAAPEPNNNNVNNTGNNRQYSYSNQRPAPPLPTRTAAPGAPPIPPKN